VIPTLFTALAPDPHRARECLTYVTGYRGCVSALNRDPAGFGGMALIRL
jgi:hypothetical protein